ncbi:MAG: hypothetical protein SGBAC_003157 [Bacillariaceae sp.]
MLILNPSRLATTVTTVTAMSTHCGLQHHHRINPCSDHTIRLNRECALRQSPAGSLSSMKRKRTSTSSLSMSCLPDAASGTKILSKVVSAAAIMARGGAGALASSSTTGGESGRIFGFFGGGPRRKMIAEVFSFASSGSAADAMLDLTRVQMRLEGLQVYATLAALLTNACLELYVNVKEPEEETYDHDDDDDRDDDGKEVTDDEKERRKVTRRRRQQIRNWAVDAFYLCTVVSILSGSYTTVVFGLFSILSKTALGRGLDASFIEFWGESAGIRNSGFESFLVALVSFEVAFILSLFTKFSVKNPRKRRRQNILVGIGTVILLTSMRRWIKLLYLASKLLFPLWAEVQY